MSDNFSQTIEEFFSYIHKIEKKSFINFIKEVFENLKNITPDKFRCRSDIKIEDQTLTGVFWFIKDEAFKIEEMFKALNIVEPILKTNEPLRYVVTAKVFISNENIYLTIQNYISRIINFGFLYNYGIKSFTLTIKSDDTIFFSYPKSDNSFPMTLRHLQQLLDDEFIGKNIAINILEYLSQKYIIFKDIIRDCENGYTISNPMVINKLIKLNPQSKKMLFSKYYKYSFAIPSCVNKLPLTEGYVKLKTLPKISPNKTYDFMYMPIDKEELKDIAKTTNKSIPLRIIVYYYLKKFNTFEDEDYIVEDYLKMSYEEDKYFNLNIKSINSMTKKHNELIPLYTAKIHLRKIKIPDDSPFKKLKMPKEYEKITTTKRLKEESKIQCNCVYSYIDMINKGKCVIYSTIYKKHRYTIEIGRNKKGFYLAQCRGYKNIYTNKELENEIIECLKKENKRLNHIVK